MNKNIKLAVAGAVLGMASAANAGIVIPAGEWTLDVGGNVNAYSIYANSSGSATVIGGLNSAADATAGNAGGGAPGSATQQTFNNGLLPNFLSVSGSTRQNDLDVAFTISLQPGTGTTAALQNVNSDVGGLNNRQAFLTFGDKSWGSVKMGKDLGIFASDAILSDATLLGVGGTTGAAGNTTLGRIGSGYIYADWKPQFAYTTPNFSGFQATVGVTQAFASTSALSTTSYSAITNVGMVSGTPLVSSTTGSHMAYEGKASYSFAANDVTGKIWVSGIAQRVGNLGSTWTANGDSVATAGDVGVKLAAAGFEAVGYYYAGQGIGTTGQFLQGYGAVAANTVKSRDSDGGYVQLAYTLPIKTKIVASWGVSNLDLADGELNTSTLTNTNDRINSGNLVKSNEQWNAMLIHPLTKHLNLVAEYSHLTAENQRGLENKTNAGSLGAILFF